jgi:CxxC motif-containing protein (DUF1111 family)
VYNATSCAACHFQGGVGGSGGLPENVTVFARDGWKGTDRQGTLHAHSTHPRSETLYDIDPKLPRLALPALGMLVPQTGPSGAGPLLQLPDDIHLSQRNTPALFGAKLIDDIPEAVILANAKSHLAHSGISGYSRALRVAGSRVGRFGWKAQSATLADFVRLACANELGLGNAGHVQPVPLFGLALTPGQPQPPPWGDLTDAQCDRLTAFVASLPRPRQRLPVGPYVADVAAGVKHFHALGCAECHTPDLGRVTGLYSDLLLHDMGEELRAEGSYPSSGERPEAREWKTPPLWGVADSAPYLHDGRAATLGEAIRLHGGQGADAAERFAGLDAAQQGELVAFLKTLRAPGAR